jgi:magnesium transporter
MAPLTEMLDRLASESQARAGDRLGRRFREERAHVLHLVEGADARGKLLSNMLQAYLTEVSVRQNDDMRRISAWVAIWAVPTLLAGIYGMNFRHLPRARVAPWLPAGTGDDGGDLSGAVPGVPAQRLAVASRLRPTAW